MKGLYLIGGAILISAALVFSTSAYITQDNSEDSAERAKPHSAIKIALSTTPLSAPFYIAKAKGFFKIAGVNVQLIEMPGGDKCFTALQNKEVDLATTSNSVIMFNGFKHTNFEVLTSFVESDNDIKIITLEKNKITTPHELTGKSVGIVKGSASEYFLHTWLTVSGVDSTGISTKTYDVNKLPEMLDKGEVDAISVWEPYAFKAKKLIQPTQIMETKGLYNLSFNLVRLKSNTAKNDSQEKILEALNKAVHFIAINPEASQLILRRHLKLSQNFVDWVWQDYRFKLSLHPSLITSLENQARWAIASGLVEQTTLPDFKNLISPNTLNTVNQNASTQK